jgi:hypothetical protein
LGSGIAQRFKTGYGSVHAPATTYPMLNNGAAAPNPIVNLGNNNSVSGFSLPQIDVTGFAAISAVGIANATIQNNTFNFLSTSGSAEAAVGFLNCGGTVAVMNNTFTTSDMRQDVAIGIDPSTTVPGIYNVIGNSFSGNTNSAFLIYNAAPVTTTYPDQLNMIGNTMSNLSTGVIVQFQSSSPLAASFQINGNTFNNMTSHGAIFIGTLGSSNVAVTNNNFKDTAGNSVAVGSTSHVAAQINNNIFSGTTDSNSFSVTTGTATSSACVELNYNTFDQPALIGATGGSQFILETPIDNIGPVPTLSGTITTLPPGQTCE